MNITFNNSFTDLGTITLTGTEVFTKDTTGAIVGGRSFVRIMATGTGSVNLSAFTQIANANKVQPESGIMSYLLFTYDGTDYNVTVWQKANTAPLDIIKPTIDDAYTLSADATKNRIKVQLSEAATVVTTAGFSFRKNSGSAVSASSVATTLDYSGKGRAFTLPFNYAYGDVLEMMYDSATGNTLDPASNELNSFSWITVKNNCPDPATVVPFTFSDSGTIAGRDGIERVAGGFSVDTTATSTVTFTGGDTVQFFSEYTGATLQFYFRMDDGAGSLVGTDFFQGRPDVSINGVTSAGFAPYRQDTWFRIFLNNTHPIYTYSLNGIDFLPSYYLDTAFTIPNTTRTLAIQMHHPAVLPQILKLS